MKRNGLSDTYYAVRERLELRAKSPYTYVRPDEQILAKEHEESEKLENPPLITIVMPAYNPPQDYFCKAIESVIAQSYPFWKLVISDSSDNDIAAEIVRSYEKDDRIVYLRSKEAHGISENTNAGLRAALGMDRDYIGFMDHDDELTPDALFRMAKAIKDSKDGAPKVLYSDEDKMAEEEPSEEQSNETTSPAGTSSPSGQEPSSRIYFDPHRKYDFNYDLLLNNNYVCHLMLVRKDMMSRVSFRPEYDGAQDYDLILQIVRLLCMEDKVRKVELAGHIVHVPKILYHWRSHRGSTATNTQSKSYAYEAGLNALHDHVKRMYGRDIAVSHSKHLGFYEIDWYGNRRKTDGRPVDDYRSFFEKRQDIGAVIGRVIDEHGMMKGVIADKTGNRLYVGINCHFAGEYNRFDCSQDVYLADIHYATLRPELKDLQAQSEDSMALAEELHARGYMILYDPDYARKA
ncbi:MAG: glycosyltransferase [Lachnospiraceae bacterium]|nr:glycosyltransferase [Lachnospiraceae bacterium]